MIARRFLILSLLVAASSVAVSAAPQAKAAAPTATPSAAASLTPVPATSTPSAPAAPPTVGPTSAPDPVATPASLPGVTGVPTNLLGRLPFVLPTPSAIASYATFVRGAERQTGLIDLVRKDEEIFFDLSTDALGKTYIIAPSLASGVGPGAFAGKIYDPLVVTFKRVGKRILWILPNPHFTAVGAAAQASLAISVADSVFATSPILAEDPEKKHVVIAPTLFLTDFNGIGADLGRGTAPAAPAGLFIIGARPGFALDAARSYYTTIKAFPNNDEITAQLTFTGPQNVLSTVPDGRGFPIRVHYSIVEVPKHDATFVPRYSDDRVGYFVTARKTLGDDNRESSFERYINRWNLRNGPITFYLTNEIPRQYKPTIRRALLVWNDAFAKIGYPHAIEVRDQPSDPNWDPDDARYTSVRWITSERSEFSAYSPSLVNPETGQTLRGEIVIEGESLRAIKRGFVETVVPTRGAPSALDGDPSRLAACRFADESLVQASVGMMSLSARGRITPAQKEKFAEDWLYSVVLHEAGHVFGLRHNFQGSTAFTYAQLHDKNFTRKNGISASVMDYNPVNLARSNETQADYFQTRLGTYDFWAIEYGYRRFETAHTSAAEVPYLAKIANRSTEPGLAYGTDEDATPPFGSDPRIVAFDLSNDPLRFAEEQFEVNAELARKLDRSGRTYDQERAAFLTILNNEVGVSVLATRYIGGIYTSRSHRGQRGGTAPFVSIPRTEQKRAFDLVARNVLSSQAFLFSPQLLNDLGSTRYLHWDAANPFRRTDFPYYEVVAQIQDIVIDDMFSVPSFQRIADQSLKSKPGTTMSLADLFTWTQTAVFDDIAGAGRTPITASHRELQRRYADLLMEIAALPAGFMAQLSLSHDTQELARYEIADAQSRIARTLAGRLGDTATRAHLADLNVRLSRALNATMIRQI